MEAQRTGALDHPASDGPPVLRNSELIERLTADFVHVRQLLLRFGPQVQAFEHSMQAGSGDGTARKCECSPLPPRSDRVRCIVLDGLGFDALVVVRPIDIDLMCPDP